MVNSPELAENYFVCGEISVQKTASVHWEQTFCFFSTQDGAKKMDQELFRALCIQYFLSDDEEDPGNFVTGKTDFSDIEVRYTPTVEEKKTC